MKVLHVTPSYFPQIGGIETVVRSLCAGLNARGHVAEVAHVAVGLSAGTEVLDGVTVHRVPLYGHRLVGLAPSLRELARKADLLHVHDPQLMAITASVLWGARDVPRVLSTHGFYGHTAALSHFKALHRKLAFSPLLQSYGRVLASSRTDLDQARTACTNAVLFENGADVGAFTLPDAPGPRDPWRWLYWGRLSRNKRPDLVVELVAELRRRGAPVQLTIAGNRFDDMSERLDASVDRLGLGDAVEILPAQPIEDLLHLIAQSGIFVSGSEYEGFGLTFIEAMAGGLNILCRDVEPMRSFATESGAGLAVDFNDIPAAADRVDAFVRSYDPAAAPVRARSFAARYDWSHKIRALEDIYRQVVEGV